LYVEVQRPVVAGPEPVAQHVQLLAFVKLRLDASAWRLALQLAQDEVGFQQPAVFGVAQ